MLVDDIQGRNRPMPPPPVPSPQAAVAADPTMSPEAMALLAALAGGPMRATPEDPRDDRYPLTPALAERGNRPGGALRGLDQAIGRR